MNALLEGTKNIPYVPSRFIYFNFLTPKKNKKAHLLQANCQQLTGKQLPNVLKSKKITFFYILRKIKTSV